MPTMIDELVMRFSIDTSNLDKGQKKVLDNLHKLEEGAKKSSGSVKATGAGIVSFFRSLEHPLASLRGHFENLVQVSTEKPKRHLADLSSQARRTGQGVAAGALEGAAGLRVLGIAGLAATVAIAGLKKVMDSTHETMRGVFNTGVGAATAGMNIRDVTAISLALNKLNDASQEDTVRWLGEITQMQNRARQGLGLDTAKATGLYIASHGTINPMADTPQQMLEKIAVHLQSLKNDSEAITAGGAAGLSDKQSLALRHAGANLPKIIADISHTLTDADLKKATDLVEAQNKMNQAWSRLWTTIAADLTPAVIKLDELLTRIADAINLLVGGKGTYNEKMRAYGAIPGTVEWFREKILPSWLGGRSPPGGAPGTAGGGAGTAPAPSSASIGPKTNLDPRGMEPTIRAAAIAEGLNPDDVMAVARAEGLGVSGYGNMDSGAMSYGAMQMHIGGLATEYQKATGKDPADPKNEQDLIRWGIHYARLHGWGPWTSVTGGHVRTPRVTGPSTAAAAPSGPTPSTTDKAAVPGMGGPVIIPPGASSAEATAIVQRGVAGWTGQQSYNVSVDSIHVHTQADTATGIAAAGLMAADGKKIVTQANTGYV